MTEQYTGGYERIEIYKVRKMFSECVCPDTKQKVGVITTYSTLGDFRFFKDRVEHYREIVAAFLGMLPHEFRTKGGASLEIGAMQENEERWALAPLDVERLFLLGMALNMVTQEPNHPPDHHPYFSLSLPDNR